jgi:hypothetical protein
LCSHAWSALSTLWTTTRQDEGAHDVAVGVDHILHNLLLPFLSFSTNLSAQDF